MNRKLFIYSFLAIASLAFISSCDLTKDEGEVPISSNQYLINYNQVKNAPAPFVKMAFEEIEKGSPLDIKFSDKVKYGVWVYKISYKTKYKNKDVIASGVVCVPMTETAEPFPILSFQNGTNTLNSKAPSMNIDDEDFLLIQAVASMGYIVVIPDYLGFGTSSDMFHPYLEKASTVQSILDMYGAVKEMAAPKYLDLNLTKDIYLMGYSQGAWASLALHHEIETKHSAHYNLKGTAAGGGAYDLSTLIDFIMGQTSYPMPVYLGYLFHSYIETGSVSFSYNDIFNAPYANAMPGLYNGLRDGVYINNQLTDKINELFMQDFRTNYKTGEKYSTLRAALKANSVEPWKTTKPIFMRHGTNDSYVPLFQSLNMYEGFVEKGVEEGIVNYGAIPLQNHNEAAIPFGILGLNWIINQD
jgi:pimeloyl-ACP methyl ester carboxylesterase